MAATETLSWILTTTMIMAPESRTRMIGIGSRIPRFGCRAAPLQSPKKGNEMSSRIVADRDYVAGWLDSSVHDFLGVLAPSDGSMKYALITCLDSNPNPGSLRNTSPELKRFSRSLKVLETGLLLPAKALLETEPSKPIFFGFDELWFFPTKNIEPKPPAASLLGPGRITQARLKRLRKWMADNSCSLGLGGGEGLNFVVRAQGLARFLLGHSLEQRDSALASA
jgi:hypothetical protein